MWADFMRLIIYLEKFYKIILCCFKNTGLKSLKLIKDI